MLSLTQEEVEKFNEDGFLLVDKPLDDGTVEQLRELVDRLFWILFSKYVHGWRAMLHALHPDTVMRWHREGFQMYWTWKSRRQRVGRPAVDKEIRKLIRQMQSTNVGWGAPRIHGELLKLRARVKIKSQICVSRRPHGKTRKCRNISIFQVFATQPGGMDRRAKCDLILTRALSINISQATVPKYMVHQYKPPSQTWRTFLENHADGIAGLISSPSRLPPFAFSMCLSSSTTTAGKFCTLM